MEEVANEVTHVPLKQEKKLKKRPLENDDFSDSEPSEPVVKIELDNGTEVSASVRNTEARKSRVTTPKKKKKLEEDAEPVKRARHLSKLHDMPDNVLDDVRQRLLAWYDENQRQMPWRIPSDLFKSKHADRLQSGEFYDPQTSKFDQAYGALVSELMLQQTQVATVRTYFEKWMKRFPTVDSLASASLDDVNAVWAGLGYYRRAKLIHECAKAIVAAGGSVPKRAVELEKLPGLGRYTAGAIASVVFGEVTPIVDGNVVRVLTRFRAIDADAKQTNVIKKLWEMSSSLVSPTRPGDFNQALMELGALVCTKANPNCKECPLSKNCLAFAELNAKDWKRDVLDVGVSDLTDIEDLCSICSPSELPYVKSASVTKYPVKPAKKAKKKLHTIVTVVRWKPETVEDNDTNSWQYLMKRRPEGGLLAGFWEFPSVDFPIAETVASDDENEADGAENGDEDGGKKKRKVVKKDILSSSMPDFEVWKQKFKFEASFSTDIDSRKSLGTYDHKFTHIDQTVFIEQIDLRSATQPVVHTDEEATIKWVTHEQLANSEIAISKVSTVCLERSNTPKLVSPKKPLKKKVAPATVDKRQPTIMSMFKRKE